MARTYGKFSDLITFTRASGGTALRPVSYGSELVTNGDFSDGAAGWSISGESTISAGVAVIYSSSGTVTKIRQIGFPVNKTLSITYTIKNYVAGGLNLGASGSYQVIPSTVGTHTVLMKTNSGELEINRQGGPTIITIDNISVKEVLFDQPNAPLTLFNHPTNIPRIEYDADGNRLGLLIEEARTNLFAYSQTFTTGWSINEVIVQSNSNVSPDGTLTATKLIPTDAVSGFRGIYTNLLATGPTTISVFAKAAGYTAIAIGSDNNNSNVVYFNLLNGTGTGGGGNYSNLQSQYVGDGWWRCSVVVADAAPNYPSIGVAVNGSSASDAGNGVDGVLLWGAQLEVGAFPTSYIPTSGSTATRAADVATMPVSEFGYNDDEGTVVVEANTFGGGANRYIVQFDDTTNINRNLIYIKYDNSRNWLTIAGNVQQQQTTSGSVTNNIQFNAIGAYKKDDFAFVVDGGSVVIDTAGSTPSGISIFRIGANSTSGELLNGHIKSIKYYPRRLTNAQLQDLTT